MPTQSCLSAAALTIQWRWQRANKDGRSSMSPHSRKATRTSRRVVKRCLYAAFIGPLDLTRRRHQIPACLLYIRLRTWTVLRILGSQWTPILPSISHLSLLGLYLSNMELIAKLAKQASHPCRLTRCKRRFGTRCTKCRQSRSRSNTRSPIPQQAPGNKSIFPNTTQHLTRQLWV